MSKKFSLTDLPLGFKFGGVACGVKPSGKLDLALISTDKPCVAAGVYTQNVVRAPSIDWNRNITPTSDFRAVVVNSGNANACTGQAGVADNQQMASLVASGIGASGENVCVLSTGVIGHCLPMSKIEIGIRDAIDAQGVGVEHFEKAANAILTTDKDTKISHANYAHGDKTIRLIGMAKGAGMIGPNMATMLSVLMTDVALDDSEAQTILQAAADASFNRISVEGHTSTNDSLILICSGESGVKLENEADLAEFTERLTSCCVELATQIPADGEGATHLIELEVTGADSVALADQVARTIAASALVKTAITGADPNWGRIVSAAGYSGVGMNVEKIDLQINGHYVFRNGQPSEFDAATVSESMSGQFKTFLNLKIGDGEGSAKHWTSDLTVDYVRFNSEYTT